MRGRHTSHQGGVRKMSLFAGIVLVVMGLVIFGRIAWFYYDYHKVGQQLATQVEHVGLKRQWPSNVIALLKIPELSLVAPVEQGTGDVVLNVAIGHLAASVPVGSPGTSVLAAHNVSWFSNLNKLTIGSYFEIDTRSHEDVFRVAWHKVVPVGYALRNSQSPSVVLEACWPLNALYLTPNRYLVGANLIASVQLGTPPPVPRATSYQVSGMPQPFASQNLSLIDNYLPMGSFDISGTTSQRWEGSSAPYLLAGKEVSWLIALLHAIATKNPSEIEDVGKLPLQTATTLAAGLTRFDSLANLVEDVKGNQANGGSGTFTATFGDHTLTITEHYRVAGSKVMLIYTTTSLP